jgi:hypothetical protein
MLAIQIRLMNIRVIKMYSREVMYRELFINEVVIAVWMPPWQAPWLPNISLWRGKERKKVKCGV